MFIYGPRAFSMAVKAKMRETLASCKAEYDEESKKKRFDSKKRKMVFVTPKEGFLSKAVRKTFRNLQNVPNTDQKFQNAYQFARRCFYEQNENSEEEPSKKKFRREGGGRKSHAPEIRDELFEWFIDVRSCLKGKLLLAHPIVSIECAFLILIHLSLVQTSHLVCTKHYRFFL